MEEEDIRIKVKSIDNEEHELCVKTSTRTEEIKEMIAEKKSVNKNDIRLIYQGQCLSNEKTIGDYNIQNEHIIHLVVRKKENNLINVDENRNDALNVSTLGNGENNSLNSANLLNGDSNQNNSNASGNNGSVTFGGGSGTIGIGIGAGSANGVSPLYFTHMRLTRNDNTENDPMGQTNICNLLNEIMSQVSANPNLIYSNPNATNAAANTAANTAANAAANVAANGTTPDLGATTEPATNTSTNAAVNAALNAAMNAATNPTANAAITAAVNSALNAAMNVAGMGGNAYTGGMRAGGIYENVNGFSVKVEEAQGGSKKMDQGETDGSKELGKNKKENMGSEGNSNLNAEQKEKRGKSKRHLSDGDNSNLDENNDKYGRKGGNGDSGNHGSSSGNSGSCSRGEEDSEENEKDRKKKKKLKKKRKNASKYKREKGEKYRSGYWKRNGSLESDSFGSISGSSFSVDDEIKIEKKRLLSKMRKDSKKKQVKNKYKKKKFYDSSSFTSDDDSHISEIEEKLRRRKEKMRKKKLFDPNLLYGHNYMFNPNHVRGHNMDAIFRGRNDMGKSAYPFALDNSVRGRSPFYSKNKLFPNFKDDLSETYELLSGNNNNNNHNRNNHNINNNNNHNNNSNTNSNNNCNTNSNTNSNNCNNCNNSNNNCNNNNSVEDFLKGKEQRKKAHKEEEYNNSSKNSLVKTADVQKSNILDLSGSGNGFANEHPNGNLNVSGNKGVGTNVSRSMMDVENIIKNSNECFSVGVLEENGTYTGKTNFANIIPFRDVERNNQLVRNDSPRINSRAVLNEDTSALLSDNSISRNIRSIQMTSNTRRNSALRRSDPKCINDINDSEYKNVEVNIPWRVMEQLLLLLEEETGYRRPDLSVYINSYYNSNSIYIFFYLFVHINNIINSIIIQFNHSHFLSNDITMSSFSRISIILSLASVIFSRLSNFFFVFYDNFYCNNYGRNYRYSEPINHEYLRELRNLYYSNNRHPHRNSTGRLYQNNRYGNNHYMHMNMGHIRQNNSVYLNNGYEHEHDPDNDNYNYNYNDNDTYYPLPYNDMRNTTNKTNLQQEFEDYYKNYLNCDKDNKNILVKKDYGNYRDNLFNDGTLHRDDYVHNDKVSRINKFYNHNLSNDKINYNMKINNEGNTNNPFSHFPNYSNKPLIYPSKKKRNSEKINDKKVKKLYKHGNSKELGKEGSSSKGKSSSHAGSSSGSSIDSRSVSGRGSGIGISSNDRDKQNSNLPHAFISNTGNSEENKKWISDMFKNVLKNKDGEKLAINENCLKNIEKEEEKTSIQNNLLNNNLVSYDSNMDDMYDLSEDGREKDNALLKGEGNKEQLQLKMTTQQEHGGKNAMETQKEKLNNKHTLQEGSGAEKPPQRGQTEMAANAQKDSSAVGNSRRDTAATPPMPNIDFSSLLSSVQNQLVNNNQAPPPRDKMIKICRNRRPLSRAYIGENSLKDDVSYSNFLPFLWKKIMSTINVNINLDITDVGTKPAELLNAFDLHVLEFVKKSIKNNEDYKSERFKYPNLSLCEELFDEADK
ncbi:ubiquitin-like protein, putative [Plasmodium ovale]|uniref:Ubiquitin-like protein, putative n=1 Tax=Plasmodium ovale TaxID=36330 RepID=A0A1C3KQN3_PLAOA|nr:ubiquitin-like protein, putative [Plasmodium ovale]